MSNYQEGQQPGYPQGGPPGGPYEGGPYEGAPAAPQGGGPGYGGPGGYPAQTTSQMPAPSGQWSGDPSHAQWSGDQSHGQSHHQSHHGNPLKSAGKVGIKDSLKSTEFWVFVVASLALLIAAAASDGPDGEGFGAEEAWRYVTALGFAYILSRGLAKLGRRDDDSSNGRRQH